MNKCKELFANGSFFLGCNWWASHAGTNMWHLWDAQVVEDDFKRLSENNIDVVRVFPLWSDFQPLRMHYGAGNSAREMRLGEEPLPETEAGRAGIDEVMAERFGILCDIAQKYNLRLIVGLVTGWMSGRMHAPEAFSGKRLIGDPDVNFWQVKFVRYMVKRFKDKPAIAAWDLGNECNCLDFGISRSEAANWAALITNTIKAEDNTRPVISGMHGTFPDDTTTWNPRDLGEILDVLCTHPYPLFTKYCNTDPLNEMKSVMHSTAETLLYAYTSGKPAFIEEIGTLGPMIASEEIAGDYIRAAEISAWAHNLYGFVWWCANEQSHLTHTPYDWDTVERELGFFRLDKSPKPVLCAMRDFSRFVSSFEFDTLPERITDATVILTKDQDTWANAYGTFIMAKQAGLDATFSWCEDPLPKSDIYIMPGISGTAPMSLHKYNEVFDRVKEGATLVMSINTALLSPFSDYTGVRVLTRRARTAPEPVALLSGEEIPFASPFRLDCECVGARAVLKTEDGNPAVTEYSLGKGRVCVIFSAVEEQLATRPGSVSGKSAVPYYEIYKLLGLKSEKKMASSSSPYVLLTEHPLDENRRLLCIINYTPEERECSVTLNGYRADREIKIFDSFLPRATEGGFDISVGANNGTLILCERVK